MNETSNNNETAAFGNTLLGAVTKKFCELKQGEKFRFKTDAPTRIRIASQVGKTEIYCPHESSNPYDETEVYLKSERLVVML